MIWTPKRQKIRVGHGGLWMPRAGILFLLKEVFRKIRILRESSWYWIVQTVQPIRRLPLFLKSWVQKSSLLAISRMDLISIKRAGPCFRKKIAEQVLKHKADAGISLDGDGDRVILSDEKGQILNGDHILGICAMYLKERGGLPGNQVVTTHLSNTGLEISLKPKGISIVRTDVGDRHVVETMRKQGIVLGGEPSGHIVFLNHTTTGDACVAALNVMGALVTQNKKLSELRDFIHEEPQVNLSVPIKRQTDLESIEGYREVVSGVRDRLGENAKVHIRFSGTESLLRILVEGRGKIEEEAHRLKDFLSKRLS